MDTVSGLTRREYPYKKFSKQVFHCHRYNTSKRVTSGLRVIAPEQHSSFRNKCHRGGKLLATLCPNSPARDLNLRPTALERNA